SSLSTTRHSRRAGISLLEVLVIVVVVALFALVMYMVAGKTAGKDKHRACASNVRDLGSAVVLYAQDHDETLPPLTNIEGQIGQMEPQWSSLPTESDQPQRLKKAL